MGCLPALCRVVVVVFNIVFLVIGLVFFALGLFLRFGDKVINDNLDSVARAIEQSSKDSGFGDIEVSLEIQDLLLKFALAFIFIGLAMIALTVMGCCGSCYKIRCMLIVYVVACAVILLTQIIFIGILYGSPDTIRDPAKKELKKQIQSTYEGLNGTNALSMSLNIVMQEVECCGVDNYSDFTGASKWVTDYTGANAGVNLETPLPCCKNMPNSDSDYNCAAVGLATDANNYKSTGCFGKIWDKTIGYGGTKIILGFVGAFQLMLIIFAIIILCSIRSEEKNKVVPASKGKGGASQRGRNAARRR